MDDIQRLMVELDGADAQTVERIAMQRRSLPVRLAMLGLAALHKGERALWWGYPPGVFIGYKWDGEVMSRRVQELAAHVRGQGYRVFLDRENLDADADAYFRIPQFIANLQECHVYVLLLTSLAADLIDARRHKTSWIHDEVQHAFRLTHAGRLFITPVLLEPDGMIDALRGAPHIDLTGADRGFEALDDMLRPGPLALEPPQVAELESAMGRFDQLFLGEQWDAARAELDRAAVFRATFDHALRRMLHALYTADGPRVEAELQVLFATLGRAGTLHVYRGYCARHGIPVRIQPT